MMFPYPSAEGLHVGQRLRLHRGRHPGPLPPPPRAPGLRADRLRRLRDSQRELRPQGRDPPAQADPVQHRATSRRQLKRMGLMVDWSRQVSTTDPGLLPLDPVDLPQALRARPGLPRQGAGQLVPGLRHRHRRRAGDRRLLRAPPRGARREARHGAVVLPHHRLRAAAARQPRLDRLVGDDQARPGELDRPERGGRAALSRRRRGRADPRLHHPARHRLRRDLHGAGAGASAGRGAGRPGAAGGDPRLPRGGAAQGHRGADGRDPGEDRRLHRRPRGEPGDRAARCRSGSPTTS